jgi:hypothetical protein
MVLSYAEKTVHSYANFKRTILSILWRMSISTRNEFKNYSLGKHENAIQQFVFDPKALLTWAFYPVVVFQLTIGQKSDDGMLMLFPSTVFAPGIDSLSFVICGLHFITYLYSPAANGEIRSEIAQIKAVALKDNGRLLVADMDSVELISKGSLFGRLRSDDVREFYRRYS